jgi:hypothetical protein
MPALALLCHTCGRAHNSSYVRLIVEREGALVAFASVPERHFGEAGAQVSAAHCGTRVLLLTFGAVDEQTGTVDVFDINGSAQLLRTRRVARSVRLSSTE